MTGKKTERWNDYVDVGFYTYNKKIFTVIFVQFDPFHLHEKIRVRNGSERGATDKEKVIDSDKLSVNT